MKNELYICNIHEFTNEAKTNSFSFNTPYDLFMWWTRDSKNYQDQGNSLGS